MPIAAPSARLTVRRQETGQVRRSFLLCCLLFSAFAHAGSLRPSIPTDTPRIAVIIDDLGNQLHEGRQVIRLPGELTVSIMPYTPFAGRLAQLAQHHQKEVMLHLPMESVDERFLGKGGLNEQMNHAQFIRSLGQTLKAVPDIRGVNNHMGSRLTQDATRMSWLMAGLLHHGELYFVDSRTTRLSQADTVAREYGLEHARRDVFLDDDMAAHIKKQWAYLLRLARRRGSAVAIGHPYPETIKFLQQALPRLIQSGIKLVPVSQLIQWRQTRRSLAWQSQPSSSPSPKAAKNSRPSLLSTCCAAPASTSSAPGLMTSR